MPINSDQPHNWKQDTFASVDMFNTWFMAAAPQAFKDTRAKVTQEVEEHLKLADDGRKISGALFHRCRH